MAPFQRRQPAATAGSGFEVVPSRRPHAGLLRRERRDLLQTREELLRRLGGLMVEMYRRNDYRDDLLAGVCAEVIAIDERLVEIEDLLGIRRRRPECVCGSPILPGARFCPSCGRDLTDGVAAESSGRPEGT